MRSRKVALNVITSLLLQFVAIACGLIVPRLILGTFGSNINGVIVSITQFLAYIILMEAGVGGVVRAALYKPLAKKNIKEVSRIIKATEQFFRKISGLSVIYLLLLSVFFPFLVENDFEWFFTFNLILVIGLSTCFQYYFGISYQILLQADQRNYINSVLQIVTIIINTFLVILLIKTGASILVLKLTCSLVFIVKPILLNLYVKRRYKIDYSCKANFEALSQKWNGFAHHIAFVVTNSTDIAVLTVLTNLKVVSVYFVYCLVIGNIKKIVLSFFSGFDASFGNMIAKKEEVALHSNFKIFQLLIFMITVFLFMSTSILIIPFIKIYTKGIVDANYYRPVFANVMLMANAIFCIGIPYKTLIYAAGDYKQTQVGAISEAIINIVISLILVKYYGLIGVAIGTLCAMLFRTIYNVRYIANNIIKNCFGKAIKMSSVFLMESIIIFIMAKLIPCGDLSSYWHWIIYSTKITLMAGTVTLGISLLFYYNELEKILFIGKRIIKRSK